MKLCTVEGCENKYRAKGLCNMHTIRLRKHGTLEGKKRECEKPLNERIISKSELKENGCIEFMSMRNEKGYGLISYKNKPRRTHRAIWEHHNGPIPEGMLICHKCDNPPCVNIDHLFLGTAQDNTNDMIKKGRQKFNNRKNPS